MVAACGVITLTTDFHLKDSFVGTMKGVILRIFPEARLVDITHQISPQDVLEASLILDSCYRFFPAGTVHLVVVDPGVGGKRRPIAIAGAEHYFVGPDNGVFTRVLESDSQAQVFEAAEGKFLLPKISDTFHGRDVFAPVTAYLARGVHPQEIGPPVTDPRRLEIPVPRIWKDQIRGEVIHVDSFGNIVTNISRRQFVESVGDRRFRIFINGRTIDRIHRNYEEQERGRMLALFGSSDLLEVAVAGGRADRRIGAGKGDTVLVQLDDPSVQREPSIDAPTPP
jgi:S-adenosyl-L-methionine hydrolase (adenosine-forming)